MRFYKGVIIKLRFAYLVAVIFIDWFFAVFSVVLFAVRFLNYYCF